MKSKSLWCTSLYWVAAVLLTACSAPGPVPALATGDTPAPPLAAEFITTHSGPAARETTWRYWREPGRWTNENIGAHTGESWQLDGKSWFHRKYFHEDRRIVEFQPGDLATEEQLPTPAALNLLIDPELLAQLGRQTAGWRDGYPYRRYQGTVDGIRWDITLRTDLQLPVYMEREQGAQRQHTRLKSAVPLAQAIWRPTAVTDYQIIDFADFGDFEHDPFVQGLHTRLAGPQAESHRH